MERARRRKTNAEEAAIWWQEAAATARTAERKAGGIGGSSGDGSSKDSGEVAWAQRQQMVWLSFTCTYLRSGLIWLNIFTDQYLPGSLLVKMPVGLCIFVCSKHMQGRQLVNIYWGRFGGAANSVNIYQGVYWSIFTEAFWGQSSVNIYRCIVGCVVSIYLGVYWSIFTGAFLEQSHFANGMIIFYMYLPAFWIDLTQYFYWSIFYQGHYWWRRRLGCVSLFCSEYMPGRQLVNIYWVFLEQRVRSIFTGASIGQYLLRPLGGRVRSIFTGALLAVW